jgi:hypothetical protein
LKNPVNGVRVIHPKRKSKKVSESFTAIRNLLKNLAEMIYVLVVQTGDFKNCCLQKGKFDGSLRNHYF